VLRSYGRKEGREGGGKEPRGREKVNDRYLPQEDGTV
jgi:hypothetical protein